LVETEPVPVLDLRPLWTNCCSTKTADRVTGLLG
jgi:hypothetical protein